MSEIIHIYNTDNIRELLNVLFPWTITTGLPKHKSVNRRLTTNRFLYSQWFCGKKVGRVLPQRLRPRRKRNLSNIRKLNVENKSVLLGYTIANNWILTSLTERTTSHTFVHREGNEFCVLFYFYPMILRVMRHNNSSYIVYTVVLKSNAKILTY